MSAFENRKLLENRNFGHEAGDCGYLRLKRLLFSGPDIRVSIVESLDLVDTCKNR
jgi:hypothetical protein